MNARELLFGGTTAGPRATCALFARLGAGAVFVIFGLGKFVNHGEELESFRTYDLPWPEGFVYVIGVIEICGGLLLILGLLTRLASLVLAGNMAGAIIVSGIGEGETISLTLAPLMLMAMVFLLWTGAGSHGLDARLLEPRPSGPIPHSGP